MKTTRILSACLLSTALVLALAPAARATNYPDLVYYVSLNVSPLSVNPNSPFSLDLQLVQGSGNVTNTVTLSNFVFVGGTATGTPDYTNGSETGSLNSTVVLTNSSSDNEFAQAFSSGVTQIDFKVDQTPNDEVVGSGTAIPDQFNVAILDNTLSNIPTTDPSGGSTLVASSISSSETIANVATSSSTSPDAGVTASVSVVPEPTTSATLLGGLIALGIVAFRRRDRRA